MPVALFITGVSTTGKTTLYERLKNEQVFKQLAYHDIDEVGVPPVGLGPWREYRTQHVLFDANASAKEGYLIDSSNLDTEAVYQQVVNILEQHVERDS